MRSFTYAIHIDAPPKQVWAFMMDFANASRWRNLVRTVEVLTPGPVREGTRLAITFDVMGSMKRVESEVWGFEPERFYAVRNTEENVTGSFEYHLEPDRGGTRVTFTCHIRPHGFMWLLLPFLLRGNRLRYREQLPRLKGEVERIANP